MSAPAPGAAASQDPRAALRALIGAHPPEFDLGRDPGVWSDWQARLRCRLWELLGGPAEPCGPDLELGPVQAEDGYSRRRLAYTVEAGGAVRACAWLLTPDAGRRRPGGVLALHGHGRGKDDPAGLRPAGPPATESPSAAGEGAFGAAMAARGHLVLIPEARGFGERADPTGRGCQILGLASLLLGRPIAGQRVRDDVAALSILRALSGTDRLGVIGLSEGGRRALLLAALDERVAATVCSGYFTRVRDEIARWDALAGWDICNALPGLAAVADLPEIASLCVPRPLCIDWGRADRLYTPQAVEAGAAAVAAAYERQGVADRFWLNATEGGHRFGGPAVLDWLEARLTR